MESQENYKERFVKKSLEDYLYKKKLEKEKITEEETFQKKIY